MSAALRGDVEGTYEELEQGLLEYLAMVDQQNRKAIGTSTPWQTVRITTTKRSQFTSTQSLDEHDSCQGWLCAVSEANLQKNRNVQEEIEETTSDGKGKGKEKGKDKGEDLLRLR